MKFNRRWLASSATAIALGVVVTGTALAQSGPKPPQTAETQAGDGREDEIEGEDVAISGDALEQAKAAALAHTGGGTVTDTEVGDEESYYEVEVTLDHGRQVDVQLDKQFNVVGDETEDGRDHD